MSTTDTWNDAQHLAVAAVMVTSASLSILGSMGMIRLAARRLWRSKPMTFSSSSRTLGGSSRSDMSRNERSSSRSNQTPVLQRLIIAMGCMDLISSISFVLQPFLLPTVVAGSSWAVGNFQSCAVVATFSSIGLMGVTICNTALSYYYLQTVKWGRTSQADFVVRERLWFAILFVIPSVFVVGGILAESMGPLGYAPGCLIGGKYPQRCLELPDVDCIYGTPFSDILYRVYYITVIVMGLTGFVLTYLVWRNFRRTVLRVRRHSTIVLAGSNPSGSGSHELLREITTQCVLYSLVFFNLVIWFFLGSILTGTLGLLKAPVSTFILNLLLFMVFPIQGLLNLVVYVRPTAKRLRQDRPELSRFVIWCSCIADRDPDRIMDWWCCNSKELPGEPVSADGVDLGDQGESMTIADLDETIRDEVLIDEVM